MKYFIILVFQKILEHQIIDNHKKALEKAKYFVMTFEDPTKAVTYGRQKNLYILELIIEAVLLCLEQEIAFRRQREQSNYTKSTKNELTVETLLK